MVVLVHPCVVGSSAIIFKVLRDTNLFRKHFQDSKKKDFPKNLIVEKK
jgi:hypothetical protein